MTFIVLHQKKIKQKNKNKNSQIKFAQTSFLVLPILQNGLDLSKSQVHKFEYIYILQGTLQINYQGTDYVKGQWCIRGIP